MDDPALPFPDHPFTSSRPVSRDCLTQAGCFTTFGARISTRDDLANLGMTRALNDWENATNTERNKTAGCMASAVGNFVSLMYLECLPDRMEVLSYMNEVAFLHDDATESEDLESLAEAHKRLDYALDLDDTEAPDNLPRSLLMKKLFSAVVLECLAIDSGTGLDMMKSYSEWLKVADTRPIPFATLDEYIDHRIRDSGSIVYWWMMAFGHGTRMSDEEFNLMEPLFRIAMRVFLLTNDFYSWPKEKPQPSHRITNAVFLYMKSESMSEQEAITKVKQAILDHEARFLTVRHDFCKAHPDLPSHLKKIVNVIEPSIGAYHYWCITCPRFKPRKENVAQSVEKSNNAAQGSGHNTVGDSTDPIRPPLSEEQNAVKENVESSIGKSVKLDRSALVAPSSYIQSLSSKNVRSRLIDAFNLWLQLPNTMVNIIKQVVDDLHNSSLILDDIQDESLLRRGNTATHIIFGNAQAINSATYMFVQAANHIHALHDPALMTALLAELESLFIGQSWELKWRFTMHCPSEDEYFAMIDHKTGAMFQMLLRLMQTASRDRSTPDVVFDSLSRLLGRWYQIRDDYMNLQGKEYTKQKGYCEDFDEGKFSYPVVRCCTLDSAARDIILGIFRQKQTSTLTHLPLESKSQVLNLMENLGVMQETWNLVVKLQREIEDEISRLEILFGETNPILRLLVKVLADIPEPCKRPSAL